MRDFSCNIELLVHFTDILFDVQCPCYATRAETKVLCRFITIASPVTCDYLCSSSSRTLKAYQSPVHGRKYNAIKMYSLSSRPERSVVRIDASADFVLHQLTANFVGYLCLIVELGTSLELTAQTSRWLSNSAASHACTYMYIAIQVGQA